MLENAKVASRRSYAALETVPLITARYIHNFPAFTVCFANKEISERAATTGANDCFTQDIQIICANEGTQERPFDAKLAITFDYPGRLQAIRERSGLL
jgi:hypothetical protein